MADKQQKAGPIVNVADAPVRRLENGSHFAASIAQLGEPAGGDKIGANVTTVPPGKAAFPIHHHFANEEHFFILSGSGVLRLGEATHAVRPHDYVAIPAGGADTAHQFVNTGTEDLVYLALSTKSAPEVVGYPDGGKIGVVSAPWGKEPSPFFLDESSMVKAAYWDNEDGAGVERVLKSS